MLRDELRNMSPSEVQVTGKRGQEAEMFQKSRMIQADRGPYRKWYFQFQRNNSEEFFSFFLFLFFHFLATSEHMEFPGQGGLGIRSAPHLWPVPHWVLNPLCWAGSLLRPSAPEMLPILLQHSRNSSEECFEQWSILVTLMCVNFRGCVEGKCFIL